MANISTYLEEALMNHVMRNDGVGSNDYDGPEEVFVGLVDDTAVDTDMEAGTLTNEITAYTDNRKSVTFTAPSQTMTGHEGKAAIANSNLLEFVDMPAADVKYAIVCDAALAGNILYWCPLSPAKSTNAGDTFRIPIGDLVLDLD